jgi:amidase
MDELHYLSALRLAELVRRRRVGCVELLEHFLARVERFNPRLNAIVHLDAGRARSRAREADAALSRNEVWGPFHGVPMTIKESFDVEGWPTTWGRPDLAGNVAKTTSVVAARMQAAGAILFGKTNVPIHLADWQSFNAVYGTTENPWRLGLTPGGSSGGSAAALAAGLTALEAGSDIGASIRNPAHYCGVFGHKPTLELCPIRGHTLPGFYANKDMMVIGPLARSAGDLEIALRIIGQPDELHARGLTVTLAKPKDVRQLRIGVLADAATAEVDDAVQAGIFAAADCFSQAGAQVDETARPDIDLDDAHRIYIHLLRGATSAALSDTHFRQQQALASKLAGREGYQPWMVHANVMSHREWHMWNEQREAMRLKWAEFFERYDLLLCPTAATAAFPHNQKGERWERMITVNGKPQPTTTQLFWAGLSGMAYLPSTVAPAGFTAEGLPTGVQIIGPQYGDLACIAAAKFLEKELQPFVAPPGFA